MKSNLQEDMKELLHGSEVEEKRILSDVSQYRTVFGLRGDIIIAVYGIAIIYLLIRVSRL